MSSHADMHALHHTREVEDMRQRFQKNWSYQSDSTPSSSLSQSGSEDSSQSHQTQPTDYSTSPAKRAPRVHYKTQEPPHYFQDRPQRESPRSSVASTVESEEDFQDVPEYYVPDLPNYAPELCDSAAIPSTPSDFSRLWPSRRRLEIKHSSTLDGNKQLEVNTAVDCDDGRRVEMTLFHLRMHDLRTRQFSLRRYCRDSGREVCHCVRKQQKSTMPDRPGFQRSLSNALHSMRPRSSGEKSPSASTDLKRNDSGYGSLRSVELDDSHRSYSKDDTPKPRSSSNVVKLEFSNYAQVDVKQRGPKNSRRYEFEYWGARYNWKRVIRKEGQTQDVAFHLTRAGSEAVLGHIVPASLTPIEKEEEHNKGGWIPPCSMWIDDESIIQAQKDVSDVVVAAGLIALVDDSIKARFIPKHSKHISIPKLQMGVEYIGPKRLMNEMFRWEPSRSRSLSNSRPSTSNAGTTGKRAMMGIVRQQSSHV